MPHKSSNDQRTFYTTGFDQVVTLPAAAIIQLPAKCQAKRLVLCSFFDAAKPHTSCPLKKKCNFVHADVSKATLVQGVHINYAWTHPDSVSYDRFPTGINLEVAPPGCKNIVDCMDSSLALKTKAMGSTRLPLQHCAHYYYTRQCDLGADCMFVHAVFIDSEAEPQQRAPVPRDIGRGREQLLTKRELALVRRPTATSSAEDSDEAPYGKSAAESTHEDSHRHDTVSPFVASMCGESIDETDRVTPVDSVSTCSTPHVVSQAPSTTLQLRYRNDPYATTGARLIIVRLH